MKRLFYLPFGYVRITFASRDLRGLLNGCHRLGVRPIRTTFSDQGGQIWVCRKDEEKVSSLLAEDMEIRRIGLPYLLARYRHRVGIFAGIALFLAAIFLSPMFIWKINISGIDRLREADVLEDLRKEGVYTGAFIPKIDRKAVYANLLRGGENYSWLSVNLRGSTANVEIVERNIVPVTKIGDGANLIAAKDGVIADVDVLRGVPIVKSGETVLAGNLLVSGVLKSDFLGARYLTAEGQVYATVTDTYCIEVPLTEVERVYQEEIPVSKSVAVFAKNIKYFKKDYSIALNYDIIYREESLPGELFCRLPIRLSTTAITPYTEETVELSEEEANARAERSLARSLREAAYADVLSVEKTVSIADGVLKLTASVEAVENIAAVAPFHILWTAERTMNGP